MINLGDVVRDDISGFIGTATAKIEYLKGTTQFQVTAKVVDGNDGSIKDE